MYKRMAEENRRRVYSFTCFFPYKLLLLKKLSVWVLRLILVCQIVFFTVYGNSPANVNPTNSMNSLIQNIKTKGYW